MWHLFGGSSLINDVILNIVNVNIKYYKLSNNTHLFLLSLSFWYTFVKNSGTLVSDTCIFPDEYIFMVEKNETSSYV